MAKSTFWCFIGMLAIIGILVYVVVDMDERIYNLNVELAEVHSLCGRVYVDGFNRDIRMAEIIRNMLKRELKRELERRRQHEGNKQNLYSILALKHSYRYIQGDGEDGSILQASPPELWGSCRP